MAEHVTRADFDLYMFPNYAPPDMVIVRGEGSRVWDQEGRVYIDLAGGIAVNCLGHANPDLVEALTDQARRLWHLSNAYANEPAIGLAKRLCELTFATKVFLTNSGAEANEGALKLARRYAVDQGHPDKYEIISFEKSFHGRTLFTVSVGGTPAYSEGFGPRPGGITHLPYNDLAAVEKAMSERTCAVMVEPVIGEGGIIPADPEFLEGLRSLCDRHGALLIFDEVQSGVGRTGDLYAYMGVGVVPDILTTAKGLGGGFPVAAVLSTDPVAASFVVGTHGSTFGGNALAGAVASRVLDIVAERDFLLEVKRKEALMVELLEGVRARHGHIADIRSRGLWIGVELSSEMAGRSKDVATAALAEGVMVLRAGADVVRFAPALNIPDEDIVEGVSLFGKALAGLV